MSKQYEILIGAIARLENEKRGMRIRAARQNLAMINWGNSHSSGHDVPGKIHFPKAVRLEKLLEAELTKAIRIESKIDDLLDQIETLFEAGYTE